MTVEEETRFYRLSGELIQDERLLQMKNFIQHGRITTYDHCLSVARKAFSLKCSMKISCDEKALIRAALLHDYFLYDWHEYGDHLHGYHHPYIAARKADMDFALTATEKKAIMTHMWPLTLFHPPVSKVGWLLTLADKMVSTEETLFKRADSSLRLR
ncbi:MAG: HD domain-containing protein [Lachnospiraceae bacterium]|nr:HD domain-containing protein [Lachnospiraceae bacterium]